MIRQFFRDKKPITDRRFEQRMGVPKARFGKAESEKTVPLSGSGVSITEFNQIFEGDCYQFDSEKSGISAVNLRPYSFHSSQGNSSRATLDIRADLGFAGLELNDQRSHAHLALNAQDDRVLVTGNSERNITLIEKYGGNLTALVDPGAGEDKTVLMLGDDAKGVAHIYGEGEQDSLEVYLRSPGQKVTVHRDPEVQVESLKADEFTILTFGLDNITVHPYQE